MINDIWLNLPVKDIQKSKAFFVTLGFRFTTMYGDTETSTCLQIGNQNFMIMLFEEYVFKSFSRAEITDSRLASEILISIGADSRAEVDSIATLVLDAGGTLFAAPAESQGWMYGCAFLDLDSHRWNVLYMDPEMMPR